MDFERDKAHRLRDLIASGELSGEVLSKAQEYVRGYTANNPQDQEIRGLTRAPLGREQIEGIAENEAQAQQGYQKELQATLPSATRPLDYEKPRTGLTEERDIFANDPEMLARAEAGQRETAEADELARLRARARTALQAKIGARQPAQTQGAYDALSARIDAMPLPVLRQQFGTADAADTAAAQTFATQKDPKYSSASQVQGFFREPEFVAKPGPAQLQTTAMGAQLHPMRAPIYWTEPKVEEFREYLKPQLGEQVNGLDEHSQLYKVYADMRYQQDYDQAKANNVGIVRTAYARKPTGEPGVTAEAEKPGIIERFRQALPSGERVASELQTGTGSFLRSATLGGSDVITSALGGEEGARELEVQELAERASPSTAGVGGVAGMFTPLPVKGFNTLSRGVSAVPGIAKLEATTGGRLLGGGLRGGVGAIGVGAAEDANRALAHAISTGETEGLIPDEETLKRAALRGAIGLGGGIAGEGLGLSAAAGRSALRNPNLGGKPGEQAAFGLRDVDVGGGRSGLFGVRGGPGMRAAEAEAASPTNIARESALDVAGRKFGEKALPEFTEDWQRSLSRMHSEVESAAAAEGTKKAVPWKTIEKLMAKQKTLRLEGGERPIPGGGPRAMRTSKPLRELLADEPQIMSLQDARELQKFAPAGSVRLYTPKELQSTGLEVRGKVPLDHVVVLRGRSLTARDAENVRNLYKEMIGAPKTSEGSYLKAHDNEGIYSAYRDFIQSEFPKLHRAIKRNQGPIIRHLDEAEALGLPVEAKYDPELGLSSLKPKEQKAFLGSVTNLEREPTARVALEKFASENGLQSELDAVHGLMGKLRLRGQGAGGGATVSTSGLRLFSVGRLRGAAQRTDSLLGRLSRLTPEQMGELKANVSRIEGSVPEEANRIIAAWDKVDNELQDALVGLPPNVQIEMGKLSLKPTEVPKPTKGQLTDTVALGGKGRLPPLPKSPELTGTMTVAGGETGTPRLPLQERIDAANELLTRNRELLRQAVTLISEARAPAKALRPPPWQSVGSRSIRGGRLGRGAAALEPKERPELSPTELMLLKLILESEPTAAGKPKTVAAK